jgi:hypothetical protein
MENAVGIDLKPAVFETTETEKLTGRAAFI